jgi:DNA repair photolyase
MGTRLFTENDARLTKAPVGYWPHPAVIQENNFVHKSLSNWSFNIAIGCGHACRFCYVPSAATIKLGSKLKEYGIDDPDAEWGEYVLLREWNERKFLASLENAEKTPRNALNPDGNRAVIYCSTTDPYQVFRSPDPEVRQELARSAEHLVRRSLELIRDRSTLRVRILTRSPLARRDFDLFESFDSRLLFGMSLPTLRNDLAKVYEPKAPSPSQRLATLQAAAEAGLNVFVAVAPTYPECDEVDLRETFAAIAELNPVTVFHEPINIRADNVDRIRQQAGAEIQLRSEVFATREAWKDYALHSFKLVRKVARETKLLDRLHLWPDKSLGADWIVKNAKRPEDYKRWIAGAWTRISEWPEDPCK